MSYMKNQRRFFTEEYRREAAGFVIGIGRSISAVAKELNLGEQTLGRRKNAAAAAWSVSRPERWTSPNAKNSNA